MWTTERFDGKKEAMKLMLAPLAGYTDKAFREVATFYGAEACITEMVSAEGLARSSGRTETLLERFDGEGYLITQLFGPDRDPFERCIPELMKYAPSQIDINSGCPVPKVTKNGSGSAMMKDPGKIYEIVKFLKEETGLPISVKFRLGWDENSINYIEYADACWRGGASQLTLHARTRAQGYAGVAREEHFSALRDYFKDKENAPLLYASGDVLSPEAAVHYMDDLGMDGVMFARGAIGNPFIIRQTKELMEKGEYGETTLEEKVKTALWHMELAVKYYGEYSAAREMRKQIMAYVKGLRGSKEVKERVAHATSLEEYRGILNSLLKE